MTVNRHHFKTVSHYIVYILNLMSYTYTGQMRQFKYCAIPGELLADKIIMKVRAVRYHEHHTAPAICMYGEFFNSGGERCIISSNKSWLCSGKNGSSQEPLVVLEMETSPVEPWGGLYQGDFEFFEK